MPPVVHAAAARALPRLAMSLLALGVFTTARADGPPATPFDLPRSYPAAVSMLREDLAQIDRARTTGQLADAQQAALRLSAIALATPPLARAPGALSDSTRADSARAGHAPVQDHRPGRVRSARSRGGAREATAPDRGVAQPIALRARAPHAARQRALHAPAHVSRGRTLHAVPRLHHDPRRHAGGP